MAFSPTLPLSGYVGSDGNVDATPSGLRWSNSVPRLAAAANLGLKDAIASRYFGLGFLLERSTAVPDNVPLSAARYRKRFRT
jgi:hypothetical protein